MLQARERSGNYVLVRQVGAGASGEVWVAEHTSDPSRRTALKFVEAERSDRVEREVRELMALTGHPSVVKCFGFFFDAAHRAFVLELELVEGPTLREVMSNPSFTAAHRTQLLHHVAHALTYVHGMGVVHRDLKPENVVVAPEFFADPSRVASVRIIDFGIAARSSRPITRSDGVAGTVAYMAPEVLAGDAEENEPARDIFAFGVIAAELLSGRHPYGAPPASASLHEQVRYYRATYNALRNGRQPLPEGTMNGRLGALLTRCVSVNPWDRPANGGEVARELDAAIGGISLSHSTTFSARVPKRPSMSHAAVLGISAALALAIAGGGLVIALGGERAPAPSGARTCRAPVPEVRVVDPPARNTFGQLRSRPDLTDPSNRIEQVTKGTYVTILTAEPGTDGECWYRVRVKGSERVGWIHSINVP